jgi:hypothetical protein
LNNADTGATLHSMPTPSPRSAALPCTPGASPPRVFLALLLAAAFAPAAWAQEPQPKPPEKPLLQPTRTLGDQVFQISVGPLVPLFFQSLSGVPPVLATGLTLGGAGSLQWNAYVSKDVRVGLEVGGMFAFSRRNNTLLMVPLTAKAAYVLTAYPFEFPLSLGLGVNIVKYVDDVYVDPIIKPGVGVFWQYDVTWSFGLNAVYWWVPHISNASDTRFGNFLEVTLSALYNF